MDKFEIMQEIFNIAKPLDDGIASNEERKAKHKLLKLNEKLRLTGRIDVKFSTRVYNDDYLKNKIMVTDKNSGISSLHDR
jgi:hypothetical protein